VNRVGGRLGGGTLELKAKGERLATPALPLAQSPAVTVQLGHDGRCWQTVHATPAAHNDATTFQDD
jgi:hypothetical protein